MSTEHIEKNRKGHLGKTPWNKGRKNIYPSHRKGVSVDEEYGTVRAEEIRKKHRERQYRLFKNPSYRENIIKNCQIITKKLWQNEDYVKKQMKSRGSSPNKSEKELEAILTNLLPNEYKYVGDGDVIIHGKCPDFININGQKKIIEFYGRYWHPPDDEPNRQFIFSLFGYKTLIVWDNEFNDLEVLREKILEFNKC